MALLMNKLLILGLFVQDTIIKVKSVEVLDKINESTTISIGGPPLYMGFAMNLIRKFYSEIGDSKIYSFVDKELAYELSNLEFFPYDALEFVHCEKSPRFKLTYLRGLEERKIELVNTPELYDLNKFDLDINNNSVFIISSIFQEFNNPAIFRSLRKKNSFIALDPQGFFRRQKNNSKIIYKKWFDPMIVGHLDCIKLSRHEAKLLSLGDDPIKIIEELMKFNLKYVIITSGKAGSYLGKRSDRKSKLEISQVPAYDSGNISDETGAGDIFFYTFIAFLIALADEKVSMAYASSMSSLLVEKRFNLEEYNFEEIERRKNVVLSNIQHIGDF